MIERVKHNRYDIIDGVLQLPEKPSVYGYLDLTGCKELTKLPDGLEVCFWLGLQDCTSITELPDDLVVCAHLEIAGCKKLKALPANLSAGSNIYLDGFCISMFEMHIYGGIPATAIQACIGRRVIDVVDHYLLRGTPYADLVIERMGADGKFTFANSPAVAA